MVKIGFFLVGGIYGIGALATAWQGIRTTRKYGWSFSLVICWLQTLILAIASALFVAAGRML